MMRASTMGAALLPEADAEAGAAAAVLDAQLAVELRDEAAHELQAERPGRVVRRIVGQSDAVVAHGHAAPAVAAVRQLHDNLAARVVRKGVLQRVEQQLAHDQAARHRRVDAEEDFLVDHGEPDPRWVDGERLEEKIAEGADVVAEVDLRQVGGASALYLRG